MGNPKTLKFDLQKISKETGLSYNTLYARLRRDPDITYKDLVQDKRAIVYGGRTAKQWQAYYKAWGGITLRVATIRAHYHKHKTVYGRSDEMIISIQKELWAPHRPLVK